MSEIKTTAVTAFTPTENWVLLQRQCKAFMDSGFLPAHVKTTAQALTIAWKGHELGIPPLQAFSSITVISGKPCLSAELMLALIYQRVPGAKVTFADYKVKGVPWFGAIPDDLKPSAAAIDKTKECFVQMRRPGGDPQEFSFTIEDARRAGLMRPGSPWEKYPAAMLRARTISAGARAVFPDAIMGCYTPEELGGEPIDAEFSVEEQATPTARQTPVEKPAQATQRSEGGGSKTTPSPSDPTPPGFQSPESHAQAIRLLWKMIREAGWTEDEVRSHLNEKYPAAKGSTKALPWDQFNTFLHYVEDHAKPKSAEEKAAEEVDTKKGREDFATGEFQ